MKTIILCISIALLSTTIKASSPKYQMAMGKNLGKFSDCKTVEDYQSLANTFEVIAKAEATEWLPLYYQTQCYILMSFTSTKNEQKDLILDKAELVLKQMLAMQAQESEIYALQGFYYTARLVVDAQSRGQEYSMLSNQALSKSLAMNQNNPRAKFMLIQNELGLAGFFKQDPTPIYAKAKQAFNDWGDFQPESNIHPNWGKSQLEYLISQGEQQKAMTK